MHTGKSSAMLTSLYTTLKNKYKIYMCTIICVFIHIIICLLANLVLCIFIQCLLKIDV